MSGLGSAGRWRGVSMAGREAVSGHAAGPFGLNGLVFAEPHGVPARARPARAAEHGRAAHAAASRPIYLGTDR